MEKRILRTSYLWVALLMLAACTNDEPMDPNALPEGKYPLEIASVTMSVESSSEPWNAKTPQTRVTENADGMSSKWEWNDTERIGVQIGDGKPGTYVLNEGKTITAENACYWASTATGQIVKAWFPDTDEPISLADQSSGLAYVLQTTETADFDKPVTLGFTHQLAKVRVVLDGTQAALAQSVEVYGYTTCTNNKGTPPASGTQDWIKMKHTTYADGTECWEANVVPDVVIDRVKVNGIETTLTTSLTPVEAALNTITISVEQAPTEIDLGTYEGTTLTVSGKTTIKGDGTTPKDLKITVEADAEVTLKDVVLSPSATGNAITCKGDATIILTGSSSLTAKSNYPNDYYCSSGIYVERGTLTIDGDGSLNISRAYASTSSDNSVGAGIGAGSGANIVIESGDISIGDVPDDGSLSGAGIGSTPDENCGNITIKGGIIRIGRPSWYSACIGSAQSKSCGDITISGESTVITFTKGDYAPWGIGNGEYGTCGTVTVGGGATVNGVKYTNEKPHTGPL